MPGSAWRSNFDRVTRNSGKPGQHRGCDARYYRRDLAGPITSAGLSERRAAGSMGTLFSDIREKSW